MSAFTREDVENYVIGAYEGDIEALERAIASDPELAALVAGEARLELALRDAAAAATFCAGCGDLVGPDAAHARCETCGVASKPGGYVVERVLVSNAHGRMYVARDADGQRVALKELAFVTSPTAGAIAAFEREAKFLRALEHPAIPRFLAAFEEGSGVHARYYLAQQLVEGQPLDAHLEDHWFSEKEIIDIAHQILDVLVYLQGLTPMVIHRDIKPANLLKRADGTIAVVDFGAAHVQGTTAGATTIGTFGYMPVEQLAGIVDATTDGYALGATLIHLLTRQEPWRLLQGGAKLDILNVGKPMRAFLGKLVAPDPKDRYANAAAARTALAAVSGAPVQKRGVAWKSWLPVVHWSWRTAAIVAVAIAALAGAVIAVNELRVKNVEELRPRETVVPDRDWESGLARLDELARRLCECTDVSCVEKTSIDVAKGWMPDHEDAMALGDDPRRAAIEARVLADFRLIQTCAERITKSTMAPVLAPVAPPPATALDKLPPGKLVDLSYKSKSLHDALHDLAVTCDLDLVVPDYIDGKIDAVLDKVHCDQALEVLLESRGLWYRYDPRANLVRIGARRELDAYDEMRRGYVPDPLPSGHEIDVDFSHADLRDIVQMLSGPARINLVMPDYIGGKITVRAHRAPFARVLTAVLESANLGYRYRPADKLLRIAPFKDLLAEDAAATGKGFLEVTSGSAVARVAVDGVDTGLSTPIDHLPLAPGKHKVTYTINGDKFTFTVNIKPGETTTLSKDLQ